METEKILIKAKSLIKDEKNWVKGIPKEKTCFCVGIAISEACRLSQFYKVSEIYDIFREVNNIKGMNNFTSVFEWNDNPKRTHRDVLEALDKTIEYVKTI